MPLLSLFWTHEYYKDRKNVKRSREEARSGPPETNKAIVQDLYTNPSFKRMIERENFSKEGREREIMRELELRGFNFNISDIELVFKRRKWTAYRITDYIETESTDL